MSPAFDPFERQILRFLASQGIIPSGNPLLVGVSGGPDSVALLAACVAVRDRGEFPLHVVHVNHGLRGNDSRSDAAYVQRLARRFDIAVTILRAEVDRYRSRPKRASLEVAARHARYGAFAAVARETGAVTLLVAHTADDQVETVLMNLMRGAGVRGVSGMTPVAAFPPVPGEPEPPPVQVVRPLLNVRRTEIARYLRTRRLRPRSDLSNNDPRHLRNRVRNELVPLMEKLRSGSSAGLLRGASAVAEAESALAFFVDRLWHAASDISEVSGRVTSVHLSAAALSDPAIPKLTRTLAYAKALETVTGTREGFGSRHLGAIDGLLRARKGSIDLARGVRVSRARDGITFVADETPEPSRMSGQRSKRTTTAD